MIRTQKMENIYAGHLPPLQKQIYTAKGNPGSSSNNKRIPRPGKNDT